MPRGRRVCGPLGAPGCQARGRRAINERAAVENKERGRKVGHLICPGSAHNGGKHHGRATFGSLAKRGEGRVEFGMVAGVSNDTDIVPGIDKIAQAESGDGDANRGALRREHR